MKMFLSMIGICLFLSACGDSGKSSNPAPEQGPPKISDHRDSALVKENARVLAKVYHTWKQRTDQIIWQTHEPEAFLQAQAFVLAQECIQHRVTSKPLVIAWLLENFKGLHDSSEQGEELTTLAQNYLKKEFDL